MAKGFTAPQVSELLEIPYATLDSWVRSGFFEPSLAQASGRGSRRLYSFYDVLILRLVTSLRNQGVSADLLQRLIASMRTNEQEIMELSSKKVIVFGERMFEIRDKSEANFGEMFDEMCLVIPIGIIRRTMQFRIMHSKFELLDTDDNQKVKVV